MILALADLHGRADLLEGVLRAVPDDTSFVFLGDAVDRGPRNRDTVRLLRELHEAGRMVLLKGNHELMLEDVDRTYERSQREPTTLRRADALATFQNWLLNGGDTVVPEYGGWDSGGEPDAFGTWGLPPELIDYARMCVLEHRHRDLLCTHAAPAAFLPGYRTPEEAATWARPDEAPFPLPDGVRMSIHGHTPLRAPTRLGAHLFVDLGAVWTGALCAVDLDTQQLTVFQGAGNAPLESLSVLPPAGGSTPVELEYRVIDLT